MTPHPRNTSVAIACATLGALVALPCVAQAAGGASPEAAPDVAPGVLVSGNTADVPCAYSTGRIESTGVRNEYWAVLLGKGDRANLEAASVPGETYVFPPTASTLAIAALGPYDTGPSIASERYPRNGYAAIPWTAAATGRYVLDFRQVDQAPGPKLDMCTGTGKPYQFRVSVMRAITLTATKPRGNKMAVRGALTAGGAATGPVVRVTLTSRGRSTRVGRAPLKNGQAVVALEYPAWATGTVRLTASTDVRAGFLAAKAKPVTIRR